MNYSVEGSGQDIPQSSFHPSLFQQQNPVNNNISIDQLLEERNRGLVISDLKNLKAPTTNFGLTPRIKEPLHSNTSALFKNQFGQTLLTFLYFSDENVQQIQNIIKMLVYKYIQQVPDDQNKNELLIIMRSYYLQYGNETQTYEDDLPPEIKKQIILQAQNETKRLNDIVVNYCVPIVISDIQAYLSYLQDISSPYGGRDINIQGISTSIAGTRQMRSVTQVLFGGDF